MRRRSCWPAAAISTGAARAADQRRPRRVARRLGRRRRPRRIACRARRYPSGRQHPSRPDRASLPRSRRGAGRYRRGAARFLPLRGRSAATRARASSCRSGARRSAARVRGCRRAIEGVEADRLAAGAATLDPPARLYPAPGFASSLKLRLPGCPERVLVDEAGPLGELRQSFPAAEITQSPIRRLAARSRRAVRLRACGDRAVTGRRGDPFRRSTRGGADRCRYRQPGNRFGGALGASRQSRGGAHDRAAITAASARRRNRRRFCRARRPARARAGAAGYRRRARRRPGKAATPRLDPPRPSRNRAAAPASARFRKRCWSSLGGVTKARRRWRSRRCAVLAAEARANPARELALWLSFRLSRRRCADRRRRRSLPWKCVSDAGSRSYRQRAASPAPPIAIRSLLTSWPCEPISRGMANPAIPLLSRRSQPARANARPAASVPFRGFQPFCSGRCADIDLGRWLKGAYRVETEETAEESGEAPESSNLQAGPAAAENGQQA